MRDQWPAGFRDRARGRWVTGLELSKSFVSKQVTQLERQLGVRLLYRTTGKLGLSDEGTRFYIRCRLIMAEAERDRAEIMEGHRNPRG